MNNRMTLSLLARGDVLCKHGTHATCVLDLQKCKMAFDVAAECQCHTCLGERAALI